ncbi:hypothetical protein RND81_02G034400 [Saponaria officinalis]|uniref:DUF4220 domain-containing protein n=1 Tax=Saponaria officinalis TaxID=3572 RepID=A0AAW1MS03_SAPOF
MVVEAPPPPPPPFLPPSEEIREKLVEQQVKIQIVLFITFLIFAMILTLGRLRSRGNSFMKLISTYSFMITAYLISFIPGLMSAPGQSNDLCVFWVAFVAYLAAVTNEISCYTLGDNEDRKKRLIVDYAVVWPLILSSLYKSLAAPEIIVPVVIIFGIVVLKFRERTLALLCATNSSNGFSRVTKIISDFTKYRSHISQIDGSDSSYNKVLVGIKEAQKMRAKQLNKGSRFIDFDPSNPSVITLDKVLDTNETFLVSTKVGKELQNNCISFAMFSTLLAKIAGYDNVDSKIFKGFGNKLPDNSFDLVEKELDFLYDYLFTNYYAIYERGLWKKLRDLFVISLFFWLSIPLFFEYRSQDHNILYVLLWGHVLDTGFTRFVILAILTIEFAQIGVFLTSKWAKVMYTCSYLRNLTPWGTTRSTKSNILQRLIRIACLVPRPRLSFFCFSTFTERKIGQYSMLNCYGEIPITVWLKCWIGSYIDLPRIGQAGSWNINLPSEIQDSILEAINNCRVQHEGKFTNGVCSLEENRVDDDIICTYVKVITVQARVILIWHIATNLFEEDAIKTSPSSYNDNDFQAATVISNYCAYLVAFFPQMLPDHVYTTQCEFDEAVKELQLEMLEDDNEENPNRGLNGISILEQARKLKEKLEQQSNLWKTLAEFWTEMLLFMALSEHGQAIEAHANSLCIGGEFITHLWALLTHAGCSRKPITP